MDKNEAYEELGQLITKIFNQYLKNDPRGQIFLNSLFYQLLHVLTSNFLLSSSDLRYEAEKDQGDDRMQEILRYIRSNYDQEISLQDLADHLYLSAAYLSKYIRRKSESGFMEMVNAVRLDHAMEDLLYTDASVMKIAMDNGFASVAAYNKAFKEKYRMTPSEFRKRRKTQKDVEEERKEQERKALIAKRIEAYLEENREVLEEKENRGVLSIGIDLTRAKSAAWEHACCRMVNVGTAMDLTRTVFQKQILFMKEKLGIEYVRFWDLYAPELYLNLEDPGNHFRFDRLLEVLDFLVGNQLKPYMELGQKPLRLLKSTDSALREISRGEVFGTDEKMEVFFRQFLQRCIRRYGESEVSTWYFELWKPENLIFQNLAFSYQPLAAEADERYFHRFDRTAGVLRRILPEVRIGGGGFSLQHYGREGFAGILRRWKKHSQQPDFISLNCYPYQIQKEDNRYYEKKSTDLYFVFHNLETAREILREEEFPQTRLHVSEYSLTLSNRNIVNDNCAKAAFLVQNAIACNGKADILGHWLASDNYADFHDIQGALFGGCGLLTKLGVPKPSFYAFEFLHNLYDTMLASDKNYVITGNKHGSIRIVCHNFKSFNYNYYLAQEDKIRVTEFPFMMDEREQLTIEVSVRNVENGTYVLKCEQVNSEYGSVQDEWIHLDMGAELSLREQDYLKKICTPRLSSEKIFVEDHTLRFQTVLQANEIQYLYISMH